MESKVSPVKTLSNHQQVTQTRIQALKYLDVLRTNKSSLEKQMDAKIQGLQHQLDLLEKEKAEKMAEFDQEIQSWTTKEVELQAQVA
eukprot:8185823-Karenia_brevis.AAC.1